jgi:cytidylate kinase
MYRCVGLAATRSGAPPGELAERINIALGERVLLDGEDVTAAIREPGVSDAASRVAADPEVRNALVKKQQAIIAEGDWVAEGRDIGSVVAPGAEVKVFLHAHPEERAKRRATQVGLDVQEVLKRQRTRDTRDSSAGRSTLEAPTDAVELDTTELTLDAVIDKVVALAHEAQDA